MPLLHHQAQSTHYAQFMASPLFGHTTVCRWGCTQNLHDNMHHHWILHPYPSSPSPKDLYSNRSKLSAEHMSHKGRLPVSQLPSAATTGEPHTCKTFVWSKQSIQLTWDTPFCSYTILLLEIQRYIYKKICLDFNESSVMCFWSHLMSINERGKRTLLGASMVDMRLAVSR